MDKKLLRNISLLLLTVLPAAALLFYYRENGDALADQFGAFAFPVLGVLTMVLVYVLYKLIEKTANLPVLSSGSLIIVLLITIGTASNMNLFKQIGLWLEPPKYTVGTASYLNSFVSVTKYDLKKSDSTQPTTPIMLDFSISQENKGSENSQFQISLYLASRTNMVIKNSLKMYDAQVNVQTGKTTHKGDVGLSTNNIVCAKATVKSKDDLAVIYQFNYAGSPTELVLSDATREWLWSKLEEVNKSYTAGVQCLE